MGQPVINQASVSIHAPREGSDYVPYDDFRAYLHVSIHAPREGSDRALGVGA